MGLLQGRDGTEWQVGQGDQLRAVRAVVLAVLVVGATLAIAPVGTAAAANTAGEDGIVFVDSSGNLKSVTQSGTVIDYGVDGPAAIGPAADIDGDSLREVPFVTSNGKVKIVDDEGEVQQLGDYSAVSARKSGTKLAIGDWDEDGNYDVFFASQEGGPNIYRVDWDERNDQPEALELFDADTAKFMLGSTDITGDGIRDLVFVSTSSSLWYVNGTGNPVKLTGSTKWGANNNIGLGEPADFDDSGGDSPTPSDFEYPRVDGSNNAGYLSNDESITKTTYSGTSANKAPPTAADITGDGVADHVYIGSNNGYLKYKQDPTLGGATGTVTDSEGNELSADASIGLVGRISSFTERKSFTSSGKNAGDTTAPVIDGGTVAADNGYVDVTASEGLYANADGTGGLAASDFTATLSGDSDGSVSGVSVDAVTKTDGSSTAGGESTVRASLSISGTPSGDETVTVQPADGSSVYDSAGNAMADTESTGSLSLSDQQAPSDPASTSPADDADGVATDTTVALTFGEDVRRATGTVDILRSNDDSEVESIDVTTNQVTVSGDTVTVDPSTSLSEGTDYYVTVDSGAIEDTAGNAYAGFSDSTTLNFTTADTTAPTVSGGSLASDNSYLDLSVSEGVYANADGTGGVSASDLTATLSGDSDGSVSGVSVDAVTRTDGSPTAGGETTLRVALSVAGTASGDETVAVGPASGTAAYDSAGNAMADTESTGSLSLSDQQAPSDPASTSPADDADGVATDTTVDLTFDEDVRTATGTIDVVRSSDDSVVESIDVTTTAVTVSGQTVTVDPSNSLSGSTDYYVTVDAGAIEDTAGNAYAGFDDSTTLNFTTVDVTAPTVTTLTATNPDARTISVTLDSDEALSAVEVAIDGPESTTLSTGAFTESADGGDYSYTASYDAGTDGEYTAAVTTAADGAGNDGASGQDATVTVSTASDDTDGDTTAPAIGRFDARAADGSVVVTVESDEPLRTVEATVGESTTLGTAAFTESADAGTYTYRARADVAAGDYPVELAAAVDDSGVDGASDQQEGVTVGLDPGTVSRFSLSETADGLAVSFRSAATLSNLTVALAGPESATLSTEAFAATTTGDGDLVYTATVDTTAPGSYNATLTAATSGGYAVPVGQSDTTERVAALSLAPRASSYAVGPGTNVTLTAGGSAPADATPTYAWDVDGDGETDRRGSTVTTAFTEPGNHSVTLVATTETRTRTATLTVRVADESGPSLGVDQRSLNFGAVGVGERATLNLTVSNPTATARAVDDTALVGANASAFAVVDTTPVTVGPGERRDLTVAFSPGSTGTKTAQLQLLTGGEGQVTVWLTSERSYIVVQQTDAANATVGVDAYNVERTDELGVNVSQPATRRQAVTIDELEMAVAGTDTFDVTVRHAPAPPASAAPHDPGADRQTLQYVRLVHADSIRFADTSLTYRVDKAALPPGTAPDAVRLSRWNGTAWNYSTSGRLLTETATHYVYRAETPGFSQFVVTGPAETSETETTTESAGPTPDSETAESTDGGGDRPRSVTGPLLASSGGLAAVLLVFLLWRRRDDDDDRTDPLGDEQEP